MKKKFLLGLGSLSIVATIGSVAAIVSCGTSETEQESLNNIDQKMVLEALRIRANPDLDPALEQEPTGDSLLKDLTINGVTGLSAVISNWSHNSDEGLLTFRVVFSKAGLSSKTIDVIQSGWKKSTGDKAGLYSIDGVKLDKAEEAAVRNLYQGKATSPTNPPSEYKTITNLDANFGSELSNLPNNLYKFQDTDASIGIIPPELGFVAGSAANQIPAEKFAFYQWNHKMTDMNAWASEKDRANDTAMFKTTTNIDFGVVKNVNGVLKLVFKFSDRVAQ
ncbi:MAG: hypothetical protein NC236_02425 [Mycoplasma sp.]|nr:hypothetical protein [Mycoplasma sp.]